MGLTWDLLGTYLGLTWDPDLAKVKSTRPSDISFKHPRGNRGNRGNRPRQSPWLLWLPRLPHMCKYSHSLIYIETRWRN